MFWRSVPFLKAAVLLAAAFLPASPALAGGPAVRAAHPAPPPAQPVPVPLKVLRAVPQPSPVAVSVAVTPAPQPKQETFYVNLRGPDGQVRRFPVEGGREAIQPAQVIVVRPGLTVTISLRAAR
jgi:hypothetical protein